MTSLRKFQVPILGVLSTLGVPVILRYGTTFLFMGYVTSLLTVFTLLGLRWLWKSDPTADAPKAVRTLLRMFWMTSGALAGIAVAAVIWSSSPIFWLLPLPFFVPALAGSVFYERTFRRVDTLPFWKKGL